MKEKVISMAKKESQDGKSKKGLPRLMELAMTQKAPMVGGMLLSAMATIASFLPYLAIYFIIQEIVGAYPDFSTLDVPKVLGYGGLALGGVLLNVLLYTASVALSHIAAYGTLYQCKINYISHKSIRDRLLSYLSFQAVQQGSYSFEIPFNRQELADYLCVDRSALSNELSKMKKEGLLSCTKNKFELFVTPANNDLL